MKDPLSAVEVIKPFCLLFFTVNKRSNYG